VNGKLALAGVDLRTSFDVWLDAVYAVLMEAPHEALAKMRDQIVIQSARLRPDRETWGLLPEHQEQMRRVVGSGGGVNG
jgi:hypothetical protein